MALVKYSSIVNDIRGSVGNATFQRGVSGSILRNKPVPRVPSGLYTQPIRINLSTLVFQWRNLTPAVQQQWKNFLLFSPDYMKRASKVALSAYNLFLKYNSIGLLTTLSYLESITLSQVDFSPSRPNGHLAAGQFWLDIAPANLPPNWGYLIRMSPPSRNSNVKQSSGFRAILASAGISYTFPITGAYSMVWGRIPVTGEYVYCEVTFFHLSMPFIYSPQSSIISL